MALFFPTIFVLPFPQVQVDFLAWSTLEKCRKRGSNLSFSTRRLQKAFERFCEK
jgi:hypothetical protein